MQEIKIGDVRVSSIVERCGPTRPPSVMFPTSTPDALERVMPLIPDFAYDRAAGMLLMSYHSYVLRTPSATVLVDTCVGEHKRLPPPLAYDKSPWLDGLAAHGLTFEDIDYVFCTHLHIDHVGWNTRELDGHIRPTFPNAKYIFSKTEFEAWKADSNPMFRPSFEDCVLPVVEAGQALLVDEDFALNDLLRLIPAPGHSPGHVCIDLSSGGERGLFTGDLMHHPVQCIEPDWSTMFCSDPVQAAATRRRMLGEYAGRDVLFLPAHFPSPTAGHIETFDKTWRFRFLGEQA